MSPEEGLEKSALLLLSLGSDEAAEVLKFLGPKEVQKLGMAIIWVTHDLGVAAGTADRIMVMYGGQIVEQARVGELFDNPRHPYTQALLESLPGRHKANERLRSISGQPPLLMAQPSSCPFAPRCRHAFDKCAAEDPPLLRVASGHDVACWLDAAHAEVHNGG